MLFGAVVFFRNYGTRLMALTLDEVKQVARLARLAINEEEALATQTQLGHIFNLISQMQAIDVSQIEPMSHAQDLSQRLRDDVVNEVDQRERFQSIAPEVHSGLYLVPKVIE